MAGALLITADTSLGSLVRRAMSGSGVDLAVAEDSYRLRTDAPAG